MEKDEEWRKQTHITVATLRSAAKRESCMRILVYLNGNSVSRTIQEVSENLEMDWGTAKHNLSKLMEAGFISPEEDRMDGRTKYFKISDKKATGKAIEYYEDRLRKLRKQGQEGTKPKVEPEIETKQTEPEEVF